VGGENIQIVHYFDHGYLDEEKSMIDSFSHFWSKLFDGHGHYSSIPTFQFYYKPLGLYVH
jgi:hypothetical protein